MNIALYCNKESEPGETPAASLPVTERTTLKRAPHRGSYELAEIHAILDAGMVCHLGITTERGPAVIPTTYARLGDCVYIHGSPASRMLRSLRNGVPVCFTVTHLDGLVLARSTLHHSMNFRSVVLFGTATEVTDLGEKAAALAGIVEHMVPGRTAEARPANERELRGTMVLALPIAEGSAKVRTGPPVDEPDDVDLPVWAGVVPLTTVAGAPVADSFAVAAGQAADPSVGRVLARFAAAE